MELDSRFPDAYDEVLNQRNAVFTDLEVANLADSIILDGFAAVFNEPTEIMPGLVEELRHGMFRKVLATGANVPLLHEHDRAMLLGTTRSGRVRLSEEPKGLHVQANMARTDLSERVKALYDAGDLKGMSYGYVVGKGNAEWRSLGTKQHRIIKNLKSLNDVCTTWDPAYAGAEAEFRSLAMAHPEAASPLQQFLAGVYPQLGEQGNEEDDEEDPPVQVEDEGEQRDTGAAATPRLAARRRQLQMLTFTLERGTGT